MHKVFMAPSRFGVVASQMTDSHDTPCESGEQDSRIAGGARDLTRMLSLPIFAEKVGERPLDLRELKLEMFLLQAF